MSRNLMTHSIAITMGDPKGVGPEIVAMIAADEALTRSARVTLFADPVILSEAAAQRNLPPPPEWNCEIKAITQDTRWRDWSDAECGRWSRDAVAQAVGFCLSEGAALVTAPISKYRWQLMKDEGRWMKDEKASFVPESEANGRPSSFGTIGHTEYLQKLTHTPIVGMMMASPQLRTVPVTIHEPLTRVPELLSVEKIVILTELTVQFLQKHFKIANPKIAMTGLNPHAGEGGTLGQEELSIIHPAIQRLCGEGYNVSGPFPADGLFARAAQGYDAVICMYHDQALIPAKMLSSVNVTMGLPFVRTSPDHGTAEDIAWKNRADAQHLRAAVEMAITLLRSTP